MVDRLRVLLAALPRTLQAGCVLLALHGALLVLVSLATAPAQVHTGSALTLVGVLLVISIGAAMIWLAYLIATVSQPRAPIFAIGYEVLIGLVSLLGAAQSPALAVNLLISIAVVVLLVLPESRAPFAGQARSSFSSVHPPPSTPAEPPEPTPDQDAPAS